MAASFELWLDRKGRVSPLRVATLAVLLWPLLLVAFDAARGHLGARLWNDLIHRTGWWALIFLLASLAITPLRRSARFARLVDVRRMVGVAAFAYALLHLCLYVVDQKFDVVKVATEIVLRLYLTIGFVALVGLTILGVTSNDTMVKRLGGVNWRRLHQVTYAITILALVHFVQQTKADVTLPILFAGLFVWLMGYRLLARWRGEGALTPLSLAALSIAAAILTMGADLLTIVVQSGQPLSVLLGPYADPQFQFGPVRPAWWVLAAGIAVVLLDIVRGVVTKSGPPRAPAAAVSQPR